MKVTYANDVVRRQVERLAEIGNKGRVGQKNEHHAAIVTLQSKGLIYQHGRGDWRATREGKPVAELAASLLR